MFIFTPLRHRPTALLWSGQLLSAVGDELYKTAIIWIAIEFVGDKIGYIGAIESAAVLTTALIGSAWVDQWDHRRTMIGVDLIRAATVLMVPLAFYCGVISFPILLITALIVSGLSALFEPALIASLPRLAKPELLQATNGLLETTRRGARILGPGLIGALNGLIPTIHFFTVDAASFVFSALSIKALARHLPTQTQPSSPSTFSDRMHTMLLGYALTKRDAWMRYATMGACFVWASWALCFTLGLALHMHQLYPDNIGAYGAMIAAYGVGNLASNIVIGSLNLRHPERMLSRAWMILGAGFVLLALAPTLILSMTAAAFTAIGGPMEDLCFMRVLQKKYAGQDLARVYRFRMMITNLSLLVVFLISPFLFHHFQILPVIIASGALMIVTGIYGWLKFS